MGDEGNVRGGVVGDEGNVRGGQLTNTTFTNSPCLVSTTLYSNNEQDLFRSLTDIQFDSHV